MMQVDAKQGEKIVTSVRISRTEHEQLKQLADAQHRSVSGQIRFLIAREVAELERA